MLQAIAKNFLLYSVTIACLSIGFCSSMGIPPKKSNDRSLQTKWTAIPVEFNLEIISKIRTVYPWLMFKVTHGVNELGIAGDQQDIDAAVKFIKSEQGKKQD